MSALSKLSSLVNKKDPYEGMSPEDKKFARLEEMFKVLDGSLSKEEFLDAFKVVQQYVQSFEGKNQKEFKSIHEALKGVLEVFKEETDMKLSSMKEEVDKEITARVKKMKNGYTPVKGVDYQDGKDGSPDTGPQIVEKINASGALIKRKAVNGLPALKKKVEEIAKDVEKGKKAKTGWGAHPLMVQGLGAVIDKNTRIINFKGSALTSVTRLADGTVEVEMSVGAGTAYTETPDGAINGSNVTYTVTNTITTVYNFAINGQFLHPDTDYTFSGTTITLLSALPAVLSGKPFTITYA